MNGVPGARRRPDQLPLGVTLRRQRGFSNFIAGPNAGAVAVLRDLLAGRVRGVVYLWGGSGSGKSHLLEACCGDASLHGRPVAYLPLAGSSVEPDMLNGLADIALLCIDDVDSVAGNGLTMSGVPLANLQTSKSNGNGIGIQATPSKYSTTKLSPSGEP